MNCLRLIISVCLVSTLVGCANRNGSTAPLVSGDAPQTQPTTQPGDKIAIALQRGIAFLLSSQQPDGSWGTGLQTRGFEVYSMVPGSLASFRVATTGLCLMALQNTEHRQGEAYQRALKFLVEHGDVRRDDETLIYNTWAHTYALEALAKELSLRKSGSLPASSVEDAAIHQACNLQVKRLVAYETHIGGWGYYDFDVGAQKPAASPTSFGIAATLIAFHHARQAGIDVPQPLIDHALHRLREMRLPNGAYLYGDYLKYVPRHPANMIRGSIGRNQACNLTLRTYHFGNITAEMALQGLKEFRVEHEFLNMGRKRPYPHDSWYATAPYYYYYGHYYAALLIDELEAAKVRVPAEDRQAVIDGILPYQEDDGSWWDFAMWDFHKPYGTAYAVMALQRLGKTE